MVYEYRSGVDYFFGTLTAAAAVSDTTLSAAAFAALPSTYTTGTYLPLVLHDPALGLYELVWVTAHTAASTSVTVVRGRQSTTARAWPSGTQVVNAPTIRDMALPLARASLPTDAHVGMRVPVSDEGFTVERLVSGAWGPSVGVANPADSGATRTGAYPAAGNAITIRCASAVTTTNGSGDGTINFRTPFPNACIAVVATSGDQVVTTGTVTSVGESASAFNFRVMASGGGALASTTVRISYIAVGY